MRDWRRMRLMAAMFRFYPETQNQPQGTQGATGERRQSGGRLLSFSDDDSNDDPKSDRRRATMAHQHPQRFLKIVGDAKQRVRETNVDEVKARLDRGEKFVLVDVREDREFDADHLPGAIHLSKGVIERDVEGKYPDLATELVLYCGGGFRSALAADNLQKMGYTN